VSLSASAQDILPPETSQLSVVYEPPVATLEWLTGPTTPPPQGARVPTGTLYPSSGSTAPRFSCGSSCWGGVTITAVVTLPAGYTCSGSTSTSKSIDVLCEVGDGRCGLPNSTCGEVASCDFWPCYDLQTDPNHCGSCGVACKPDQSCDAGACVPSTGSLNLGVTVISSSGGSGDGG
jgi:hypothetical protein